MIAETFLSIFAFEARKNPSLTEIDLIERSVKQVLPSLVDPEGIWTDFEKESKDIAEKIKEGDKKRQAVVELWKSWKLVNQLSRSTDFEQHAHIFVKELSPEGVRASEAEITPYYEKALVKYHKKFPVIFG